MYDIIVALHYSYDVGMTARTWDVGGKFNLVSTTNV
jgi:hypothetical protein